jgi:hypothetical protein
VNFPMYLVSDCKTLSCRIPSQHYRMPTLASHFTAPFILMLSERDHCFNCNSFITILEFYVSLDWSPLSTSSEKREIQRLNNILQATSPRIFLSREKNIWVHRSKGTPSGDLKPGQNALEDKFRNYPQYYWCHRNYSWIHEMILWDTVA